MVYTIQAGQKGRALDVNNALINNYNGIISGCLTTLVSGLTVEVAAGTVLYQQTSTDIAAPVQVTLAAADASDPRIDLIVYNGTTFTSITGTAAASPQTPNYDIETNTVVAMVNVAANQTTLEASDLIDTRVYGGGAGGGTSGTIKSNTFTEIFTSQTSVVVTHNLNDSNVIVQVIDENFQTIIPSSVDRTDANTVTVTFGSSQSGRVLVHGGSSSSIDIGGLGKFVKSFTSLKVIDVIHNLADLNPVVQVYDTTGKLIVPDQIEIINNNQVRILLTVASSGSAIVQGGALSSQGTGGLAKFEQNFTNQTTVTVVHNLSDLKPTVQVYDDTNTMLESDVVDLIDSNTIRVSFSVATSGTVVVQGGQFTGTNETIPVAGTQGNILYDNGSNYVSLSPGTAGQKLQTNGFGANPTWADVNTTSYMQTAVEMAYKTQQVTGWENGGNTAAEKYTSASGLQGTVDKVSTTAIFDTDHYECQGGAGAYSNSSVIDENNTLKIDSSSNALTIYTKDDIPTNTSLDIDVNTIIRNIINQNTQLNSSNSQYIVTDGTYVYYSNQSNNNYLYRINIDGTNDTQLNSNYSKYIVTDGTYVYYRNQDDGAHLYRININGNNEIALNSSNSEYITTDGTYVYYSNVSNGGYLYRINIDGTNETQLNSNVSKNIATDGTYVYYRNGTDNYFLYRINIDGTNERALNSNNSNDIATDGTYVYYRNQSDNNYLYRINTDGTNDTQLNSNYSQYITTDGIYVYYTNNSNNNYLYRINTDGTNDTQLNSNVSYNIATDGTYIYYTNNSNSSYLYRYLYETITNNPTVINATPNTVTDISTLEPGDLKLTFNLNTTDTSVTPIIYGWGIVKQ